MSTIATIGSLRGGSWSKLQVTSSGKQLTLSAHVLERVQALNFHDMTQVQAACIPLFLDHKDVAVEAATGSGKTLAFLVPIVEILLANPPTNKWQIGAIVISPTRELALQTFTVLQELQQGTELTSLLLVGGSDAADDATKFQEHGGNIIIATPGRLEDSFKRMNQFRTGTKNLEVLVLDEADKLLAMGFEQSISAILTYLPKQRRTGLFSATQTKQVNELIRAGLRNPVSVSVKVKSIGSNTTQQATPSTLDIACTVAEQDVKFDQLVAFLTQTQKQSPSKFIVYFSTCACANYFGQQMKLLIDLPNFPILILHGKIAPKARTTTFEQYRDAESAILVCTDIAARGLDFPDVDWVVQFDPPQDPATFVHRCGRTARIGKEGNALVYLLPKEADYVEFLKLRQIPVQVRAPLPDAPALFEKMRQNSIADRDIYEKSILAFVTHVQSYKNHLCSYLFQVKDLDYNKMAVCFGLVHLPRMPELKSATITFVPSPVSAQSIAFTDRKREKQRQEKMKKIQEERATKPVPVKRKPKEEAWSKNRSKLDKKAQRKEKKAVKAADVPDLADWDLEELAEDTRLLKKYKSGKISKEEFDASFGDPDLYYVK